MNKHIRIIALLLAISSPCLTASAQAVNLTPQQQQTLKGSEYNPGSLLIQRMKELQRYNTDNEAAEMKEKAVEEEEPKVVEGRPEAPEVTLTLEKLEIPDSDVLSREELDAISSKYSGKTVAIADLYDAIDEINTLYAKKGYITTRAILPPQKIENNIVKIMLIEGKVGQVIVDNNKYTKSAYIKRCLKVPEGVVPNVNAIRRSIQRFNTTNKTILQIKMVAGEKPLTTDFYIVAVEPKQKRYFSVFSDNSGSESTGKYRFGMSYSDINLSGRCDIFNLTALTSRNSQTGMVSYNTPIGYNGSRLSVSHNTNHMRVSKGYMKDLDVRGNSHSDTITFTKPIKSTINKRSEIIIDAQNQKSVTKILGNEFANDKDKRYAIGYSNMFIKRNQIIVIKPTYTYNQHKNIDGDKNNGDRITLDSMWQKYQKKGDIMSIRVSAQKDLGDFVSSTDQYYLGGQYSVRGYHENVIGGESGVNVKFDYSFHTSIKGLNFVTFFDWGRLSGETLLTTKEIYSAGFGFEYQRKHLAFSIFTGYPMKREIGNTKTDKNITNFTLSYSFD